MRAINAFYTVFQSYLRKKYLPKPPILDILIMLCYVGSQRCPLLAIRYSEAESRPRRIVWEVSPRSRNDDTGVLCNVIL